jgi:plasmid stability protein
MALSLSIKGVPDDLVEALRERAANNHRSLQGELMHILEAAVRPKPFAAHALAKKLQAVGLATPNEAVMFVRQDRDRR